MATSKSFNHEKQLSKAVRAVKNGMSQRQACRKYGVKLATLSGRVHGVQPRNQAHESQQLLNKTQEKVVVRTILRFDDFGIPPRLTHVRKLIYVLAQARNPGVRTIGVNYFERFVRRHTEVQKKIAARLDKQRSMNSNYYVIMDYNRKLRRLIEQGKFKPCCILNFDEKGFIIGNSTRVTVLCRSNRRNPTLLKDGTRELITVVETILADGTVLPPFIIFQGKSHTEGMYYQLCNLKSEKLTI